LTSPRTGVMVELGPQIPKEPAASIMPTSFACSPRSEQAAELLARRLSIRKVAKRVECSEKTIDRWKQHSEFRERIGARQSELLSKMRGECLTIRRRPE